jgi:hypothetical protein
MQAMDWYGYAFKATTAGWNCDTTAQKKRKKKSIPAAIN